MAQIHSNHEPGERHAGLRIISVVCTGIGAILLVAGVLILAFGLYSFLASRLVTPAREGAPFASPPTGVVPFMNALSPLVMLWALGPMGAGIQFLAMGYLIRLAIQVEENTRTTARCLEKLCSRAAPSAEPPGPRFVS